MKHLLTITARTGMFVMLFSLITTSAYGQITFGSDIASRYIWRGIDFGQSLSFQPSLPVAKNGFELGAWGAYANSGWSFQAYSFSIFKAFQAKYRSARARIKSPIARPAKVNDPFEY